MAGLHCHAPLRAPRALRWMGVEHAYLTENQAHSDTTTAEQLTDFITGGFVTYSHEPLPQAQMKIYYDCLVKHAHKHDWMAFFDMDEFLVLTGRCAIPSPPPLLPPLPALAS